jgi:hypothetical protein
MAKPTKDRVPLTSYWNAIKQANPSLTKSPLFKPDIMGPIGNYDKCLANYTKQLTDKDKLLDMIKDMVTALSAVKDQIDKHCDERDKVDAQDKVLLNKFASELNGFKNAPDSDADMAAVSAAMANYVAAKEDSINMFKALTDRVFSYNQQATAKIKKISVDYKTKSAAITTAMNKLDGEALTLEGQIRGIVGKYQQIAVQMDHDDVVDGVRELLTHF